LLLAARAARQAGLFEEAENYRQACANYPGDVSAESIALEKVLLRAQRGETEPVLDYCYRLVDSRHPDAPLVLEALVQGYLKTFRLRRAGFCLKIWLDRQPDNLRAMFLRGVIREYHDNYQQAADDFRRVLKGDPDNDEVHFRLSNCLLEMSRARQAVRHLEYLHERDSKNLTVLVMLARCRYALGSAKEAARLLDQVLASAPRLPTALIARGQIALQSGQPAQAEKLFKQCVAVDPSEYQGHFLLQQALYQLGKKAEADEEKKRAQALQAEISRVRNIVTKELEDKPDDPELHYQIGMTMLRAGNLAEGLEWLHRALQKDPRHRPSHAALADYYLRIGNVSQSLQHQEMAGKRS
jgi:tetratricopeptide (TPR) repeat protein